MDPSQAFLDRFTHLYLDSFLANVAVGVLLGALGLFVILRRVVFLSAALSQVAGAGLALAFFIGALMAHQGPHPVSEPVRRPALTDEHLERHKPENAADREIAAFLEEDGGQGKKAASPVHVDPKHQAHHVRLHARGQAVAPGDAHDRQHEPFSPLLISLFVTVVVALLLGFARRHWRSTQESVVGLVFILASGASIIMAQLAEKGAHEITQLLFGTVIFIPPEQQLYVYLTAGIGLLVYVVLFKDFTFVSFDSVAAQASRFPVRTTNAVLFSLLAVSITVCTRAVGAMPVFALTVLPPAAALQLHDRMGPAALVSALLGGFAAAGGYFLSGLLNLSAGPLIVLVGTATVLLAWAGRRVATVLRVRSSRA